MSFDGLEALGGVDEGTIAVGCGFDGLATPACLLADLQMSAQSCLRSKCLRHTILYMGTDPYESAAVPNITLKT